MLFVACGGSGKSRPKAESAAPPAAAAPSDAGTGGGGGLVDAAPDKPFARSSLEASQLIDQAIDSRAKELAACAIAARKKRKDEHARVVLDIGIDQEGQLLGVKLPKGTAPDDDLVTCVTSALKTARFPRSNVGVITVKKTFEDVVVAPSP
jgi:hypothetical protein